jgi:four helix bundle protein
MRDHRNLRAFELADELALDIYRVTNNFPRSEQYGLTFQMRRAGLSTACNIVEGCARSTQAELLRFLDVAYGSARELDYQISIAHRLRYIDDSSFDSIRAKSEETCRVVAGLIRAFRRPHDFQSKQIPDLPKD